MVSAWLFVSKVVPSRNLGWVDQMDVGDLSNRENRITCKQPARAMHRTFVQEPLGRLIDNIHGDSCCSQRLELSVLFCCSSRRLTCFARGTTSSAWHTAVLTQAYTPCAKLSRSFGATFTEWAISNRLSILHFRFLAFWHCSIFMYGTFEVGFVTWASL